MKHTRINCFTRSGIETSRDWRNPIHVGESKKRLRDDLDFLRFELGAEVLSDDVIVELVICNAMDVAGCSPFCLNSGGSEYEHPLVKRIEPGRQRTHLIADTKHTPHELANQRLVSGLAVQQELMSPSLVHDSPPWSVVGLADIFTP